MKRNEWKRFPWEENDDHGYAYPKTDLYQVHDIGRRGWREGNVEGVEAGDVTVDENTDTATNI